MTNASHDPRETQRPGIAIKTLGPTIRRRRMVARLSQAELADRLGVTQAAVSYWETARREPCLDDLFNLAEVFGCSAADLLPERLIGGPR